MFEQVRDVMEDVAEKGESIRRVISRDQDTTIPV